MKVGFTGTRRGMSAEQARTVEDLINSLYITELHHGDCVGADRQAHEAATARGIPVIIHPPALNKHRAYCVASNILPPLPYLDRNKAIVDSSEMLMATPQGAEAVRSGTWSTIRYADGLNKLIYIIKPDGGVSVRNGITFNQMNSRD